MKNKIIHHFYNRIIGRAKVFHSIAACVTHLYFLNFVQQLWLNPAHNFQSSKTGNTMLKTAKFYAIFFLCFNTIAFTGCVKEVTPSDAITPGILTQTTEGLTQAVNGAYALFKDHVPFNGTSDDN